MIAFFERHRGRLLALSVLMGVFLAAWFLFVMPIAGAFADQSDGMDRSKRLIAAYQTEIASRKSLELQLSLIKQQETVSAGLIDGKNADLAAANMQNLVKAVIDSEQGQVHSAQNLPSSFFDGFERIAIQYDVSLPLNRLKDTAYRLETQLPYLFLDSIDIHMTEAWQSEGAANDPPPLQVRWTVHGYRGVQKS
jgi:hypothetical protein